MNGTIELPAWQTAPESEENLAPQAVPPPVPASLKPENILIRFTRWVGSTVEWIFGALTLIGTLAVFSVIPFLNFLSLGYLLEVSGRVARSKRIREGFVGVRKAAVFGRIIFGTWLVLWPARFISGMWQDAELIAAGSRSAIGWRMALYIVTVITLAHIVWACLRGGKLRHFFWPAPWRFYQWVRQENRFSGIQNAVMDYLINLRLGYYFKLGAFGFLGGLAWLIVPVSILIVAAYLPPGGAALLGLFGSGLLFLVALHLPFLQAHYATENRFSAMFEVRRVRQLFKQAPVAFWVALVSTLLFSIPLYLLKIEFPPKEIAWLPSLLFVVFIFPARIITGWALGRALKHEQPRHWFFRWFSRFAIFPVVGFYVLAVYITQYLSWNGALSLIEQHAFLVPAPMLSM
jgi:hypothetical protein